MLKSMNKRFIIIVISNKHPWLFSELIKLIIFKNQLWVFFGGHNFTSHWMVRKPTLLVHSRMFLFYTFHFFKNNNTITTFKYFLCWNGIRCRNFSIKNAHTMRINKYRYRFESERERGRWCLGASISFNYIFRFARKNRNKAKTLKWTNNKKWSGR